MRYAPKGLVYKAYWHKYHGGWLLPYGFTFYIIFSLIDLFGHIDYSPLRHFGKDNIFSIKTKVKNLPKTLILLDYTVIITI